MTSLTPKGAASKHFQLGLNSPAERTVQSFGAALLLTSSVCFFSHAFTAFKTTLRVASIAVRYLPPSANTAPTLFTTNCELAGSSPAWTLAVRTIYDLHSGGPGRPPPSISPLSLRPPFPKWSPKVPQVL